MHFYIQHYLACIIEEQFAQKCKLIYSSNICVILNPYDFLYFMEHKRKIKLPSVKMHGLSVDRYAFMKTSCMLSFWLSFEEKKSCFQKSSLSRTHKHSVQVTVSVEMPLSNRSYKLKRKYAVDFICWPFVITQQFKYDHLYIFLLFWVSTNNFNIVMKYVIILQSWISIFLTLSIMEHCFISIKICVFPLTATWGRHTSTDIVLHLNNIAFDKCVGFS